MYSHQKQEHLSTDALFSSKIMVSKVIMEEKSKEYAYMLNTNKLPSGIYMAQIVRNNTLITTGKVIRL